MSNTVQLVAGRNSAAALTSLPEPTNFMRLLRQLSAAVLVVSSLLSAQSAVAQSGPTAKPTLFIYTPASGSNPATFVPPASVGKIFNTVGDSREIQFALKFIF